MTKKNVGMTRRPYRKPQLEQVRLVIDEAVLETCKIGGQAGPNANNCAPGQGCPRPGRS